VGYGLSPPGLSVSPPCVQLPVFYTGNVCEYLLDKDGVKKGFKGFADVSFWFTDVTFCGFRVKKTGPGKSQSRFLQATPELISAE
jgi:hypothetical protein